MTTNQRRQTGARNTTAQWHRKPTSKTQKSNKWATGYSTSYRNCEQKIQSWRTVYNQTWGPAKFQRPSPTTLRTFTNWINKGANVYTVTPTQLNKWAGASSKNYDWTKPTQCKSFLTKKYGKTTIKAVARSKNGSYMVACTPPKGKQFNFPR